ncbi:hypothetical protein Gotri_011423, partial [Gossypium trilobum]|nr:hypothetical protein [Gossypium trilobum]
EEYTTLLRCPRIQAEKAYSGASNIPTFLKRLISITRMNEQWFAGIDLGTSGYKEKSQRLRLEYLGLVIFPKAPGHIDDTVEKVSYRVFSENYSPLKEFVATPR